MKRGMRPSQLLVVVMLALAGVGPGHVAEYLLLAPDAHERHDLLARTGHHYLPFALHAGAFAALVGLSLVFLLAFQRGLRRTGNRRSRVCWKRLLPAVQVLAFLALEVGERLVTHASLDDIGVVLAVGLPLQALVGYLATRGLAALEQVGERLGRRARSCARRPRRGPTSTWPPLRCFRPAPSYSGAPIPARGPPSVLVLA